MPSRIVREVLVVDDHRVLADLIAGTIDGESDMVCAGVAEDTTSAMAQAAAVRPDTVLLDAMLPSGDGVDLLPQLREIRHDVRAIVLTGHPRPDRAREAFARGAVGYLGKDARLEEVLEAIRHASVEGPACDARLEARATSVSARWRLSPREHEVLVLLAEGKHVGDIAAQLGLSMHTARDYVKTLLRKTGARSQLEAVTLAAHEGVVRVGLS